jgi:hypothetical protein
MSEPETIANQSAAADHAHATGGSSVNQIRITDKSKAFIVATLVAINVLATVMMFAQWKIAEREARLLEYYVMEIDGKMMASGLLKPPDSWSGRKQH